MTDLTHDLAFCRAAHTPDASALQYKDETISYGGLAEAIRTVATALTGLGLGRGERLAVFLEKRPETVIAMLGANAAGAVFVPVNPVLKPKQVEHILNDCDVRVLVTSQDRLVSLRSHLGSCRNLTTIICVGDKQDHSEGPGRLPWMALLDNSGAAEFRPSPVIDQDMAAILYTSGSTGLPKGVVLSHRNIVAGARSVAQYLENTADDRILCVPPFSFDYGLNQLTTSLHVGATAVLMNYLLPRDVVEAVAREGITGLGCVPPLWGQLADIDWPQEAAESLRYFTNTGGHLSRATLSKLRERLPRTRPFLMYGLTEAFRSTYLPPEEVDRRPNSVGKAIPGAEILVVRENGEPCEPHESGELVHRGIHVSLGYWRDPERTAQRFRPVPGQDPGLPFAEIAVWSGDTVKRDEDGFIYFVGRRDEMIKTSGYRVSPTEIEEVVLASGAVGEAVAIGIPRDDLGHAIVIVATPPPAGTLSQQSVIARCRRELPSYMVPQMIVERPSLPRNANGKIDRKALAEELRNCLDE